MALHSLGMDENDLTCFFGALPEEEPGEEREFFQAPLYRVQVEGMELEVSISRTQRDCYMTLRKAGASEAALEYKVKGITSISTMADTSGSRWLCVVSEQGHEARLSIEPTIQVRINSECE